MASCVAGAMNGWGCGHLAQQRLHGLLGAPPPACPSSPGGPPSPRPAQASATSWCTPGGERAQPRIPGGCGSVRGRRQLPQGGGCSGTGQRPIPTSLCCSPDPYSLTGPGEGSCADGEAVGSPDSSGYKEQETAPREDDYNTEKRSVSMASSVPTPELVQQVALLNWLNKDDVESKEILQAVVGLQVAHKVLNHLTGQNQIDQCKKECIAAIAEYVSNHPRATPQELNKVVEQNIIVFASKLQAL